MTDTQLTITPDAMKAASKALRALVRAKTGQDIAHSSVLNVLAKGLGLGDNFGAMLAAHTPAPPRPHDATTVLLAFDLTEAEINPAHDSDDALTRLLVPLLGPDGYTLGHGWLATDRYAVDGGTTVCIWATKTGLLALPQGALTAEILATFDGGALQGLSAFLGRKGAIACAFHSGGDVRELSVDFRYRSTGQICTASVQENVWKAAHDAGLDLDDALRIVGFDCEIADESIEVLDTRVDFGTIWNG